MPKVDPFRAAYEAHRTGHGIRESSLVALRATVGQAEAMPVLGGWTITVGGLEEISGDGENEFLQAAIRLYERFRKKTK